MMPSRSDVATTATACASGDAHAPAIADTPRSPGRTPRRDSVGGSHVPAENSWQRLAAADWAAAGTAGPRPESSSAAA